MNKLTKLKADTMQTGAHDKAMGVMHQTVLKGSCDCVGEMTSAFQKPTAMPAFKQNVASHAGLKFKSYTAKVK